MPARKRKAKDSVEWAGLSPTRNRRFDPAAVSPARGRYARTEPHGSNGTHSVRACDLRCGRNRNWSCKGAGRSKNARAASLRHTVAAVDGRTGDFAHVLPRISTILARRLTGP